MPERPPNSSGTRSVWRAPGMPALIAMTALGFSGYAVLMPVAPLWAALVARLVQATGAPLGLAQPALYDSIAAGQVADGFRDITAGDNGSYAAAPGWDACTGLGVPDGAQLLSSL